MKIPQAAALCLEYHKSNSSSALKVWEKISSNETQTGVNPTNCTKCVRVFRQDHHPEKGERIMS